MNAKASAGLAMDYFPDVSKKQARRLFRQMVKKMGQKNPHFIEELEAVGFDISDRYYTPLQLQVLFRYVGEP